MSQKFQDIDLQLKSYSFDLPEDLIADRPAVPRDRSRLLIYDAQADQVIHETFHHLANYLPKEACLVQNNSKVFPCRMKAMKKTGGKAEIFLLSLNCDQDQKYPCLIKSSSKKNLGDVYFLGDPHWEELELLGFGEDGTFYVRPLKDPQNFTQNVFHYGQVPIPPYIRKGESDAQDLADYQTLYAKDVGSVAAPTAGLHFTENVFESLKAKNIEKYFVTLHVVLGTFRPVKTENILDHQMHAENFLVTQKDWEGIVKSPFKVAVGTTSLRVLESLWPKREQAVWEEMHETSIFLHPGIEVQSIDGLITNFHLPESSLLMLVSSLIGREKTLELYRIAVEEKYRFFSYGDAMLILLRGLPK